MWNITNIMNKQPNENYWSTRYKKQRPKYIFQRQEVNLLTRKNQIYLIRSCTPLEIPN